MSDANCSVDGCARAVFVARSGLCQMHYHRAWRHGDPGSAAPQRIDGDPRERWRQLYEEDSTTDCWMWTGPLDRYGYGEYSVSVAGETRKWRAHRWVYTVLVRGLRADEDLDHLCRVHACVNPKHLEPVSHLVNVQRGKAGQANAQKTHCAQGHEYTAENTRYYGPGAAWRECRACTRARTKAIARRKNGTDPDWVPYNKRTHCSQGHEYTPENTRVNSAGHRSCRKCARVATRESQHRRRARDRAERGVVDG